MSEIQTITPADVATVPGEITLYECHNTSCPLGSKHDPGQFTGGITKEQATLLTGNPEPVHGAGVCPTCGTPGTEIGTHQSLQGDDSNQAHHDAVAARVADESDPLTGEDAQVALQELVGEEESADG